MSFNIDELDLKIRSRKLEYLLKTNDKDFEKRYLNDVLKKYITRKYLKDLYFELRDHPRIFPCNNIISFSRGSSGWFICRKKGFHRSFERFNTRDLCSSRFDELLSHLDQINFRGDSNYGRIHLDMNGSLYYKPSKNEEFYN